MQFTVGDRKVDVTDIRLSLVGGDTNVSDIVSSIYGAVESHNCGLGIAYTDDVETYVK